MSERFNELPAAPVDAIMLANAAWPDFLAKHADAINTTIGVMIDPSGQQPWQPKSVQAARRTAQEMAIQAGAFGYQTQAGYADFLATTGRLVFGEDSYIRRADSMLAYQASGGTGALSLAKDVLSELVPRNKDNRIPLVLDPGWPNHKAIFAEPFAVSEYQHLHPETRAYDHEAALVAMIDVPNGAVFLLQTCGYNDDGADRTPEQWDEVLAVAEVKDAVVILDSAYMGLVDGFETDRYPIEQSVQRGLLTITCFSASKNMGLYNERLGALFIANAKENLGDEQFPRLGQLASRVVRRTVSNPPLVVAKAAALALKQPAYAEELKAARTRLNSNRTIFAQQVQEELPTVGAGRGLFTKLLQHGFSEDQQAHLADKGIFALQNSRINLGGLHRDQVERVGEAVMQALKI